jgi:hypothetical protein
MAAPQSLAYDFGVARRAAEANLIKSWRRMGDRAIMVLEILGVAPAFERELVGEQDEVRLSGKSRADGREAIGAHLRPRALDAVGEQLERRDVGEIG